MTRMENTKPDPEDIYREFAVPISRLCRRMFARRESGEDAAQEIWQEIVRSLPSFQGRSKLSTWVWTIARRTALRLAKREKAYTTRFLHELFLLREEDGMAEIERIPSQDRMAWIRLQCDDCLSGIMQCLSNEDRIAYLLRQLVALPFSEIAEIVERDEAALRKANSRAQAKVNRFLEGNCSLYNPSGGCRCKLSAPLREVDSKGEYRSVRELAGSFLQAAESYHPPKDYWKALIEGHRAS
jgi:RNA polymerase sigma-70 factor (ECF subfamily)